MSTSNGIQNFDAILAELETPFPPELVEFKPGAVASSGDRALALAYVDARAYQSRLDASAPGWSNTYRREYPDGRVVIVCVLTVAGVTREAVGECLLASDDGRIENNAATSAEAQAFKRACAMFGLGRYLYALPQVWADYDPQRRRFTPEGVTLLREGLRSGQFPQPAPAVPTGNGNGAQQAAAPAANGPTAGDPVCPKCGGSMWDNRATKRNPKAPDFKCKQPECDGVIWPPRQPIPATPTNGVPF